MCNDGDGRGAWEQHIRPSRRSCLLPLFVVLFPVVRLLLFYFLRIHCRLTILIILLNIFQVQLDGTHYISQSRRLVFGLARLLREGVVVLSLVVFVRWEI